MTSNLPAPAAQDPDHCEVCGQDLGFFEHQESRKLGYQVCHSFHCRQIMCQKADMPAALFKFRLETAKNNLRIARQQAIARAEFIKKTSAKELREHKKAFNLMLQNNPGISKTETQWIVIPSGLTNPQAPSQERIENYRKHLQDIVEQADKFTHASQITFDTYHEKRSKTLLVDQTLQQNPNLKSFSDSLCSQCKGGCCSQGRNHAYLSLYTLRCYMDQNPQYSKTEVIDKYISSIKTETIQHSCINHTAAGCALPRNMRSDICNGFYCDPVKSFHKKMAGSQELAPVVVIQRCATYWNRLDPDVDNKIIGVTLINTETH